MEHDAPPPPPPPHGSSPRPPGGLPDGNYDIFIIPPHSAGSGFLYLPSMTPNRNSFLAGVACTLFAVGLYSMVVPTVKQWMHAVQSGGGGLGVITLVAIVGVGAWAWGKTQAEGASGFRPENGNGAGASGQHQRSQYTGPPPRSQEQAPPPPPQPDAPPKAAPKPAPKPAPAASGWEKAREETRRREEERKRAEELKKKREEAAKMREEAERAAKAKAEKEKWEQARAREKETREREARERIAREREQRLKEQREKEQKEREAREDANKKKTEADREKAERIRAAAAASVRSNPTTPATPSAKYEKPTARSHSGTDTAYSYRPYDKPKSGLYTSSASSISGLSDSSYAPSMSTARTTPPPSHRGPYTTSDPDKIKILTVALFSDSFPNKPRSQLVANEGPVTDGLILNIRTAGLFIDDDVRGVPQREWDVKAWTLKLVEDGMVKLPGSSLHVLRATTRDTENKKYCFVLEESEAWKVAVGLQRLRKGSQVRSLGMNGMKESEVKGLLATLGYL